MAMALPHWRVGGLSTKSEPQSYLSNLRRLFPIAYSIARGGCERRVSEHILLRGRHNGVQFNKLLRLHSEVPFQNRTRQIFAYFSSHVGFQCWILYNNSTTE